VTFGCCLRPHTCSVLPRLARRPLQVVGAQEEEVQEEEEDRVAPSPTDDQPTRTGSQREGTFAKAMTFLLSRVQVLDFSSL
jgi:hypothetical protein